MNPGIEYLSKHITPETSGIIWLTDDPLNYETQGVYEFNYLLNGMLVKSITKNKTQTDHESKSNFFLGENFGSPLFIGHAIIKEKKDLDIIHGHFQIATSVILENSTIYIFNKSKNTANINILKELSTKYKQYKFENLNI